MSDIEKALRRAKVWLQFLIKEGDVEPTETTFTIRIKNRDGSTKQVVETLSLSDDMLLLDRAIILAGETLSQARLREARELEGKA